MEALAALGVTGNVLQFVQFISTLLSTGKEIYYTSSGLKQDFVELNNIYAQLAALYARLQPQECARVVRRPGFHRLLAHNDSAENKAHINTLQELAQDCQGLCNELLQTVANLRVKETSPRRRFDTFKAALKTVWHRRKIEEMEARIDRYQKVISTHFFPILRWALYPDSRPV